MRTVGPTVAQSFDVGNEALNLADTVGAAIVVGTLVKPVVSVDPSVTAFGSVALVGFPNARFNKTISEPRGPRQNSSQVPLPRTSEMLLAGVRMVGTKSSMRFRAVAR